MNTILNMDELRKLNHLLRSTNQRYLYRCKKCGMYVYKLHDNKFVNDDGFAKYIPSCEEYTAIKNMDEALE